MVMSALRELAVSLLSSRKDGKRPLHKSWKGRFLLKLQSRETAMAFLQFFGMKGNCKKLAAQMAVSRNFIQG